MTCRFRYYMLKTNSCKCPKSLAQYNITLASSFVVCTVICIVVSLMLLLVSICFWNRRICAHIGMMTVPWRKWIRRKQMPEMHSLALTYTRCKLHAARFTRNSRSAIVPEYARVLLWICANSCLACRISYSILTYIIWNFGNRTIFTSHTSVSRREAHLERSQNLAFPLGLHARAPWPSK